MLKSRSFFYSLEDVLRTKLKFTTDTKTTSHTEAAMKRAKIYNHVIILHHHISLSAWVG